MVVSQRLAAAGIRVRPLPGTGLVADLGAEQPAYRVALRADLDALPVRERTGLDWASTTDGVCHACGHDVHVAARARRRPGAQGARGRRCASRASGAAVLPAGGGGHPRRGGGCLDAGRPRGGRRVFALHCDPSLDVGQVGPARGADHGRRRPGRGHLTGRGGHTSRPHLTEDLTFALAKVVTEVPAVLSRRLDPRAGRRARVGRGARRAAPPT